MNKKRVILISIVIIVVAVIAGVFVVRKKQNVTLRKQQDLAQQAENLKNEEEKKKQNNDEIASIEDLVDGKYQFVSMDMSTWQTYSNKEMGFEVKIPKNWYGEKWNEGACLREKGIDYKFEGGSGECAIYISSSDRYSSKRTNFREFVLARKQYPDAKVETLEVGGTMAIFLDSFSNYDTMFFKDKNAWSISLGIAVDSYPKVVAIYPAVLESFQFLK